LTGNRKTYEDTPEEAQACFAQIEEAARELYDSLGLGGDTQPPLAQEEAPQPAEDGPGPSTTLHPDKRRVTLMRSRIDRARRYLRDGNPEDAMKALNLALSNSEGDPDG
jgi:Tfp pilus assembly protein FimV